MLIYLIYLQLSYVNLTEKCPPNPLYSVTVQGILVQDFSSDELFLLVINNLYQILLV